MVVNHNEPLGRSGISCPQFLPASDVSERLGRRKPQPVVGPATVFPIRLDVVGRDGRPVLEDGVLAQLDRPDGHVVAYVVSDADVGTDRSGPVDLVDGPVDPRREDPLPAAVTPRCLAAVTVGHPDLLQFVQPGSARHDKRGHVEPVPVRLGGSSGSRDFRWRWDGCGRLSRRRLGGWPRRGLHRHLGDTRGRRRGRRRLGARRNHGRNQQEGHELTGAAPERSSECGHQGKLFHHPTHCCAPVYAL